MKENKKYAVVTAISSFRIRYVIPMDELQEMDPVQPVELAWAEDCVTCNEVAEFSQLHLGEQIVDTIEATEDEVLTMFDADNDYLASWTKEVKLGRINNWREKY